MLTNEKKLALLNSMRIVDADISCGELIYAVVDYNEANIEKLAKVVPSVEEYIQTVGDPDGTKETIDISTAAFQYAGADLYSKGRFINVAEPTKIESLEAENAKFREALEHIEREAETFKKSFKKDSESYCTANHFSSLARKILDD